MSRPKIYLAGLITGQTYEGATQWRKDVEALLGPGIATLSPMRAKEFLQGQEQIAAFNEVSPLTSAQGILARDHFDVKNCDLILMNLRGARSVSLGTMVEVGWALAYHKPIILIMEDQGNPHEHPFLKAAVSYRVRTVGEAVDLVWAILSPYAETPQEAVA